MFNWFSESITDPSVCLYDSVIRYEAVTMLISPDEPLIRSKS